MIDKAFLDWFMGLLSCDSSTGQELSGLQYLEEHKDVWSANGGRSTGPLWQRQKLSEERFNLYANWGKPRLLFCTHVDTVAPYIPPTFEGDLVCGRGSCDAKGQIFTLLLTVRRLLELGFSNFGVLIVVDEERDSGGAKLANQLLKDAGIENTVVLEPTVNRLITAAKGSLRVQVEIEGKNAHSGYPQYGIDAIQLWASFNERLKQRRWTQDELLGETTFNWGELHSSNADNVLSSQVEAIMHWRTTFVSHEPLLEWLMQEAREVAADNIRLTVLVNRKPFHFKSLPGFATDVVAFGCDGPNLSNLGASLLYGPGDILVAHGAGEKISLLEIEKAVDDLVRMSSCLLGKDETNKGKR